MPNKYDLISVELTFGVVLILLTLIQCLPVFSFSLKRKEIFIQY
jgi:hypothetical protein